MHSKCNRKGCNWKLEVAHMDEALERLREHYRAVHPTKAFYMGRECENLETYNLTADEIMESYNTAGRDADPVYDWRYLASQLQRWQRDAATGNEYYHPDAVAEVARRVEANPQPAQQAPQAQRRARLVFNEAPAVVEALEFVPLQDNNDAGF